MIFLQDFMSGKTVFRNIMGILLPGVNSIITQRTTQVYGLLLEKAVLLCLEILLLVLEKDVIVSDFWRPLYQVSVSNIWHCFLKSYFTEVFLSAPFLSRIHLDLQHSVNLLLEWPIFVDVFVLFAYQMFSTMCTECVMVKGFTELYLCNCVRGVALSEFVLIWHCCRKMTFV